MFDLVSMLKKCGLNVPPADNQPPIIYHNGAANYPGETMQQAVEVARKHFRGTEPAIIFCLLPDTGASPTHPSMKHDCQLDCHKRACGKLCTSMAKLHALMHRDMWFS